MKSKILIILAVLILSGCHSGTMPIFGSLFSSSREVMVSRGDTLYSISKRYNVQMKDLISANGLKSPYNLKVGQRLYLPKTYYHTVKKGDTLYSISKKYGTDVTTLSRANHISSPSALYVGQKLLIPSGTNTASYTPAASSSKTTTVSSSSKKSSGWSTQSSAAQRTKVTKYRKNKFEWPVKGSIISKFGPAGKGINNDGINIAATKGTAVKAADGGTVVYSGNELKGYGNLILIKHSDGWVTAYAHNEKLFVRKGQKVIKGEKIATVGSTGGVNRPQLHFETRAGKNAHNPVNYLP